MKRPKAKFPRKAMERARKIGADPDAFNVAGNKSE
jgi:hypothetical protein